MGKVDGNEFVVARGEGARVWDVDGREYLDGTAGLWFVNIGHGRSEVAAGRRGADGAPRRPPLLRRQVLQCYHRHPLSLPHSVY